MKHTPESLANQFKHHEPQSPTTSSLYEAVRSGCLHLADLINELAPDSHELDVAIDKLNEVMFWANAAIARNESSTGEEPKVKMRKHEKTGIEVACTFPVCSKTKLSEATALFPDPQIEIHTQTHQFTSNPNNRDICVCGSAWNLPVHGALPDNEPEHRSF